MQSLYALEFLVPTESKSLPMQFGLVDGQIMYWV